MTIQQDDELKVVVSLEMLGESIAQNVYYARYLNTLGSPEEDVSNDLAAWVSAMYTEIVDVVSDLVSINEITISLKVSASPLVYEQIGVETSTLVGTVAGDPLPHGVALVVRIATVALKSIARKYLPGLEESHSNGIDWSATALAAAASYAVEWLAGPDDVSGRTYEPGIVSTKDGLFKVFKTTAIVSTLQGYQRRRKPGVGI